MTPTSTIEDLEKQIDGNSLSTEDKVDAIENYIKQILSDRGKTTDLINSSFMTFVRSIYADGIKNNQFVTYLKNYANQLDEPLQENTAQIVQSLIDNGALNSKYIEDERSFLYDDRIYDKTANENNYKLKSAVFLSNSANAKKYGAYRLDSAGNPTKELITQEDILDMSGEKEIRGFLNKFQSKDKDSYYYDDEEDKIKSGYQVIKDTYNSDTIGKTEVSDYIKTLLQNNKFSDKKISSALGMLNAPNYHDKLITILNTKYGNELSDDTPSELFNTKLLSWINSVIVANAPKKDKNANKGDTYTEQSGYQILKSAYGVKDISKTQVAAYVKTLLQDNNISDASANKIIELLNTAENHEKMLKLLGAKYGSALSDDTPSELFNAKLLSWLNKFDVTSDSDWKKTAAGALIGLGVSKKKVNDIMKQVDESDYNSVEDFISGIISNYNDGV